MPDRSLLASLASAACLLFAGCGDGGRISTAASSGAGKSETKPLKVTADFYPVEEAASEIGGDRAEVTDLTPPGGEPHDLELKPAQLAELEQADLVLYLGDGFQPQVEKAVSALPVDARAVDLLSGVKLRPAQVGIPGVRGEVDGGVGPEALKGNRDPHVWVDPARFIATAERVRDALVAADPAGRSTYEANAERYIATLRRLDGDFRAQLRDCAAPVLVTSHAAFGYLADRYGLAQAAIAGISPEAEPDPKSLAATAAYAKQHGVTTVFFETLVPRKLADTVATTIGARTDTLNPVEGLTQEQLDAGESYVSIQRENLAALVKGLRCTGA